LVFEDDLDEVKRAGAKELMALANKGLNGKDHDG
jgi:hypothetical protein